MQNKENAYQYTSCVLNGILNVLKLRYSNQENLRKRNRNDMEVQSSNQTGHKNNNNNNKINQLQLYHALFQVLKSSLIPFIPNSPLKTQQVIQTHG